MNGRTLGVWAGVVAAVIAGAPAGLVSAQDQGGAQHGGGIHTTIDALSWIAGDWRGSLFGGDAEERWSAPWGGVMVGTFRLARDGRTGICEFMIIEEEKDGTISYRFKHYGRGWNEWEPDEPLTFTLVSASADEAVFEATREQNVRRMRYRLEGETLFVEVDTLNDKGPESFTAEYTRVRE